MRLAKLNVKQIQKSPATINMRRGRRIERTPNYCGIVKVTELRFVETALLIRLRHHGISQQNVVASVGAISDTNGKARVTTLNIYPHYPLIRKC